MAGLKREARLRVHPGHPRLCRPAARKTAWMGEEGASGGSPTWLQSRQDEAPCPREQAADIGNGRHVADTTRMSEKGQKITRPASGHPRAREIPSGDNSGIGPLRWNSQTWARKRWCRNSRAQAVDHATATCNGTTANRGAAGVAAVQGPAPEPIPASTLISVAGCVTHRCDVSVVKGRAVCGPQTASWSR
ncbi:MAG: hypothetical protein JWQ17_1969 [Tardiphaga sp.]|jgi:hypothetical protein|nr:hypothetical protein [Tardiphaga sp.]